MDKRSSNGFAAKWTFQIVVRLGAAAVLFSASWNGAAQDPSSIPSRIIVGTREVPPFAMKNENGEWTGISIDLLREVKAELQNEAEHEITLEFREMGLNEMLDAVENGRVDVAAAAITVNYEREKRMDFTHPFHSSGLGIAVGADERRGGWTGVIQAVFSTTFLRIIVGLLAAMFVSAVAVYFFERRRNREHFGGVVYDAAILQYETHRTYAGELFVLPATFERQDYAFALPSDSPLRERINQVLLREISGADWKDLLSSYLGEAIDQ